MFNGAPGVPTPAMDLKRVPHPWDSDTAAEVLYSDDEIGHDPLQDVGKRLLQHSPKHQENVNIAKRDRPGGDSNGSKVHQEDANISPLPRFQRSNFHRIHYLLYPDPAQRRIYNETRIRSKPQPCSVSMVPQK